MQHIVLELSQGRFKNVLQPVAQKLHDSGPHWVVVPTVEKAITTLDVTEAATEC